MPSRIDRPKAQTDSDSERLLEAVVYLSQQAGILIDLIEDIHEDLSWMTRNGIPHQPLIVRVEKMARDPVASDWGDRLKLAIAEREHPAAEAIVPSHFESLVHALADPLGQVAPEKLATLVSLFDYVKQEVVMAIRSSPDDVVSEPPDSVPYSDSEESPAMPQRDKKQRRSAPPGQLF